MRLVFLGTPAEAVVSLRALHDAGHDVALVVTQPDRRRGRGSSLDPSPVKVAATVIGLDVVTPRRAVEVVDAIEACEADLGVVVAFGQILPDEVIAAPRHGFVNLHFSLLPRWRGAAPVERAILAGDRESGVCLMELVSELDAGPVHACERVPIPDDVTAGELREHLAEIGGRLLVERIGGIPTSAPTPQVGEVSYAEKLDPREFEIDWTARSEQIVRLVRAGNPSPGAWTMAGSRRLKVWRAHSEEGPAPGGDAGSHDRPGSLVAGARVVAGHGVVVLDEVQAEGKRPVTGAEWERGARGATVLGGA